MPYCPNATVCQESGPVPPTPLPPPPPECDGCMAGMSMTHCPNPQLCGVGGGDSCVMSAVFSASGRTCLLFSAWHVDSDAAQWLLVIVGVWLLAFLREGLTVYRTWAALVRRHEDAQRKAREANGASRPSLADPADVNSIALEPSSTFHTRAVQLRQPFMASPGSLSDAPLKTDGDNSGAQQSSVAKSSTSLQASDSLHYLLSLAFGYLLMLLIMTYNVWVCLLVLAGCAFWHFLLHWCLQTRWKPALVRRTRRTLAQDANEQDVSAQGQAHLAPSAGAAAAALAATNALEVQTAPVSGEHCCDDLVFDD